MPWQEKGFQPCGGHRPVSVTAHRRTRGHRRTGGPQGLWSLRRVTRARLRVDNLLLVRGAGLVRTRQPANVPSVSLLSPPDINAIIIRVRYSLWGLVRVWYTNIVNPFHRSAPSRPRPLALALAPSSVRVYISFSHTRGRTRAINHGSGDA